eukprot:3474608-Rhodomonas_salina.1
MKTPTIPAEQSSHLHLLCLSPPPHRLQNLRPYIPFKERPSLRTAGNITDASVATLAQKVTRKSLELDASALLNCSARA